MRIWVLAVALLSTHCFAGTPYPDAPHVVANGEGKVSVAPDMATISLRVDHHDPVAGIAKQSVDRGVNALLKLASDDAVAAADVTASDLSVWEDTDNDDHGRRVSDGFQASRSVVVKLHDLGRLDAFLDAALAAGATRIDEVDFASSRADELRRQARAKAAADARTKASDLATGFDAVLGPVYSIDSVDSNRSQGYGRTLDRIEVTGSRGGTGRYLQPTVDYTERVSVVFALRQ
jgi:uncharacterized protein YggE